MLIVNLPYIGSSKVPGSNLGFSTFLKNVIFEKDKYFKYNEFLDMTRYDDIKMFNNCIDIINNSIETGKNVLIFGGDHSTTEFIYSKVLKNKINNIIIFDAHNDYEKVFCGKVYNWNFINVLENYVESALFLGYRYKDENMIKCGRFIYLEDIDFLSPNYVKSILKEYCKGISTIYISIDLDVLNPIEFPGVGFKVSGGISLRELLFAIKYISKYCNQLIIDIVEFNPIVEKTISLNVINRLIKEIIDLDKDIT
ncbi:MAG: arginase family protein [Clostridium argentinense]|nr:arginase family protein [Clostridium argentinense]